MLHLAFVIVIIVIAMVGVIILRLGLLCIRVTGMFRRMKRIHR
jgi:hypothetical protein